jgi:glutaredoxin
MNYTIYTKDSCIWCVKAKELMKQHHISYEEKKLGVDYTKDDLVKLLGRETNITVPQILIGDRLIGGHDDLVQYMEDHGISGPRQ